MTRRLLTFSVLTLSVGCFSPEPLGDIESSGSTSGGTSSSTASSGAADSSGAPSTTNAPTTSDDGSTTAVASGSDTSDDTTTTGGGVTCSAPELLSAFPTVGQTQGVAVRGIQAFLTETNRGLHVIDISDPTGIAALGTADLPNPRRVAVASGVAYVADPTGLIAVDVGNPASPIPLETATFTGSASDVAVDAGRAYVTTENNGDPCPSCGLSIVDIGNPMLPEIASIPIADRTMGVAVEGNTAYVVAGIDGIFTFDVGALPPMPLGMAPVSGDANDVAVAGGHAYIAAGSDGLRIFDVSNPAAISPAGSVPGSFVLGVAVEGNWAWIADSDVGLRVIDVTDPDAPFEIASVDTFGSGSGVAVNDGVAFVTSWDGDLRVFAPPVCR